MNASMKGGSLLLGVNSRSPALALPGRLYFSACPLVEARVREPWTMREELDPCVSVSLGSYLGLIPERQVPQLALSLVEGAELQ